MTGPLKLDHPVDPDHDSHFKTNNYPHDAALNGTLKTRGAGLFIVNETHGKTPAPSRESTVSRGTDAAPSPQAHACTAPTRPLALGLTENDGPMWVFDVLCDLANVADRENLCKFAAQIELTALALSRDLKNTAVS